MTSGFEVIGDLTKVLSVYGADGIDRGEIPKWENRHSYCRKIFSRLALTENKKLKILLKKDVKPR